MNHRSPLFVKRDFLEGFLSLLNSETVTKMYENYCTHTQSIRTKTTKLFFQRVSALFKQAYHVLLSIIPCCVIVTAGLYEGLNYFLKMLLMSGVQRLFGSKNFFPESSLSTKQLILYDKCDIKSTVFPHNGIVLLKDYVNYKRFGSLKITGIQNFF